MAAGDGPIHPLEPTPSAPTQRPGNATGTTTRRRAKSFLRNYYGIQQADAANRDGSKESTSAPGPVSKSDPYDLDSHAFEADKYMHKMFVEKQLPGLVQSDNELVADIRQLDGDMKTLVYENYSKFLSATDTINKMKSNVDNLESEMSRLTNNISKIATSSADIHSSLGGKREKIRQLNGVHSLLTKLQFVFELPTNLHQCLETGSYTQAVKSYCRTLHLLQHYKHLTVFTGIERECKAIMGQIAQKIRQKMSIGQATIAEISECVGLLLALKEDPVALWTQYLELAVSRLKKVNAGAQEEIKKLPLYIPPSPASPKSSHTHTAAPATPKKTPSKKSTKSSGTHTSTTDIMPKERSKSLLPSAQDKVSYLNANYLRLVESFVISFRNYFLSSVAGSGSSMSGGMAEVADEAVLTDQAAPAWIAKDSSVFAGLSRDQQNQAAAAVKTAVSKVISGYLDTIGSFLDYSGDLSSIRPEVHVYVLQNLYLATISCSGLCQLVGFDVLANELIQNWESQLIERALGKIKDEFMSRISDQSLESVTKAEASTNGSLGDENGSPVRSKETTQWFLDVFRNDTVPFLEKCMSSDAQFMETTEGRNLFLKNLQGSFKSFWDRILKEMVQSAQSTQSSSKISLWMSCLCFEISNSIVEQVYKTLSKTLFRVGKRNRSGSFLIESYEEPPVIPQLQWDCKSAVQSCQESGHALLDGFIARTGNELSWLVMDIRTSVDYTAMESPPRGVSLAWEKVYQQLNDIEHQVIVLYGDDGDRGHRDISSESTRRESVFKTAGGSMSGNGGRMSNRNDSLTSFGSNTMNSRFENQQRNMLLSNIDKLFSDRVEIFIRCQDLNRTGIMFGIIKILLKAWAESVRQKTFGRGGFQQVQVDAEFAKVWLWRFASADERLMHSLLEETQQTAYRRCIDPEPLDMNTVESIIASSTELK